MIILACLIPEEQGDVTAHFTRWPLHITLVPWFEISGEKLPKFLTGLESIAHNYRPIRLNQAGSANFGAGKTKVTLIRPTSEIISLHQDLLQAIVDSNALLLSEKHTGSDFRPHITQRADRSVPEDKVITSNKLYLVAKEYPNQRQIVHSIAFSKARTQA